MMNTTYQPIASTSKQDPNVMTWYACGKVLPSGMLGDRFENSYLTHIRKIMPNLVPTTYEAAKAYLREENKKPKAERDLLREMVMIVPLGLPKDRKTHLVIPSVKTIFPIYDGAAMVFPTIEIPPDSFGSPEICGFLDAKNSDSLDYCMLLYEPPTDIPQKGTIALCYLTKSGPDEPVIQNCPITVRWDKTARKS